MYGQWLLNNLNKIPKIKRWQGKTLIVNPNRNDAEHMWSVALICDSLAKNQEFLTGKKVNIGLLLQKAIMHDCIESETGDILSGVKRTSPHMRKALSEVELILYNERIEKTIPYEWRTEYKKLLLNPKDNYQTIEGKILAIADNIDAMNECIQEIKFGNTDFYKPLIEISECILHINLECGNYFLKNCLKDFGLPLNSYGKQVEDFIKSKELT